MSNQSRDIRHFIKAGVTIGVDVNDGEARVAVAFTNRKESGYSRPAAHAHINLRFDADDSTIRSLGIERNVVCFPYAGQMPRKDIVGPIVLALKAQLELREKTRRYEGSVTEMKKIISLHAMSRRRYHKSPSGKLPGMGLNDEGRPTPAICSGFGGPEKKSLKKVSDKR